MKRTPLDNCPRHPASMGQVTIGSVYDGVYFFQRQITLANLDHLVLIYPQFAAQSTHDMLQKWIIHL